MLTVHWRLEGFMNTSLMPFLPLLKLLIHLGLSRLEEPKCQRVGEDVRPLTSSFGKCLDLETKGYRQHAGRKGRVRCITFNKIALHMIVEKGHGGQWTTMTALL